jgi:23S rRNA (uracil1939-C5)-methyltransferase
MQEYQGKIKEAGEDYVLVMDPPRSGSTEEFISAVSNAGIKHIVYVSCNPETLARDLRSFIKKKYKVSAISPVDMFPWTEHVEVVILLRNK